MTDAIDPATLVDPLDENFIAPRPQPRGTRRAGTPPDDPFGPGALTTFAPNLPDRVLLYAPEKWGKTSFASHSPNPLFLLAKGEDGLHTLKRAGQVPANTLHFPRPAATWAEVERAVSTLTVYPVPFGGLCLDVLGGFERLLMDYVCQNDFRGKWADFIGWGRGIAACVPHWIRFLESLDRVRASGHPILLLAHAQVQKVPNPAGPDYERWQPAQDRNSLWPLTQRWADVILFGGFDTSVDPLPGSPRMLKASGGTRRVLYCQPTATAVAGNRIGLPDVIDLGDSPAQAWATFESHLPYPFCPELPGGNTQ